MAVAAVASKSLKGNDVHTPSSPMRDGSMRRSGMRKMTWRARLRNIDFPAFPMLWKNVVETIWNPTTQKAQKAWWNARDVTSMSVWSMVNARAIQGAAVSPPMAPTDTTAVPHATASQ